jgi:hypothetical protein
MSWVKRNLYFLLGSLATVGLLAIAVVYLLHGYSANNQALDALNKAYDELRRLNGLEPNPGRGNVDNIKIAQEQQKELRAFLGKARERFAHIPAIPDSANLTTEEFTTQLRLTIDQMQRDAAQASVLLPTPKYNFTFESIRPQVKFANNSLQLLSAQLGEVKAICDILFRAKINSLDSLRREQVCPEDSPETSPSDYLDEKSVTNELGVLAPYEITFRCFSSELAGVIGGFANSPGAFIIKYIDIGPAAPVAGGEAAFGAEPVAPMVHPLAPPVGGTPGYYRPGMRPGYPGYAGRPGYTPPQYTPTPVYVAPATGAGAGAARSASQPVINESVFKVLLQVEIVKFNLPK